MCLKIWISVDIIVEWKYVSEVVISKTGQADSPQSCDGVLGADTVKVVFTPEIICCQGKWGLVGCTEMYRISPRSDSDGEPGCLPGAEDSGIALSGSITAEYGNETERQRQLCVNGVCCFALPSVQVEMHHGRVIFDLLRCTPTTLAASAHDRTPLVNNRAPCVSWALQQTNGQKDLQLHSTLQCKTAHTYHQLIWGKQCYTHFTPRNKKNTRIIFPTLHCQQRKGSQCYVVFREEGFQRRNRGNGIGSVP